MATTPATDSASLSTETTIVDILLCVFASLLCLFICSGNVLTILAILRTESLMTYSNMYVAGLAGADFFVGISLIFLAMFMVPYLRITLYYRYINLCVFMQGIVIGMFLISVVHLCLIATERYLYIVKPYLYQRVMSKRLVVASITITWVLGLVYTFTPQFIYIPYGNTPLCDITSVLPIGYMFYCNGVIYVLANFLIILMYAQILKMAFQQQNAIRAATTAVTANNTTTKEQGCLTRHSKFRRATLKNVKFFLTVFGVFFICVTPIVVCASLDYYVTVNAVVYRFLNLVSVANSGMNFIIYSIQNRHFRYAIFRMIPCFPGKHTPVSPQRIFNVQEVEGPV